MNYSDMFSSLAGKQVLVVGDVMLDSYIWGNVHRISPEAPVPVVHAQKTEHRLGGAANVAKNLSALGLSPVLCTIIGDDDAGKTLKSVLDVRGISTAHCMIDAQRMTTVKTRVMCGNHQMLRIDSEQNNDISPAGEKKLCEKIVHIIEHQTISALILQDYNKGVLTESVISCAISCARAHNIPVFVDPKQKNFTRYTGVQLFKPNFKEFCEGSGSQSAKNDIPTLHLIAKEYMQKHGIERIMITLSEHGVFIANKHEYFHIPTQVRHVADVSGAGDTVISVATACLIAGVSDFDMARIANIAAGRACEMPGVVSITKDELLKLI